MAPPSTLLLVLAAAATAAATSVSAPRPVTAPFSAKAAPQNFSALECAVVQFASTYAASKLPAYAAPFISDSLNVELLCAGLSADETEDVASALAPHAAALAREAALHTSAREQLLASLSQPGAVASFFVATTGSDSNPGTQASPFATLQRAAAAARSITPRSPGDVTVFVRAGTYYLGSTGPLVLSEADSSVAWAAFPGDAPEPVVLSGAVNLGSLSWANATTGVPGILVASVAGKLPPDARAEAWAAAHPQADAPYLRAGPPPLVASLFINGQRQVRARYPNGNPQDGSGICFSATQRPGEGCTSYTTCVTGATGTQPAPGGQQVHGGPDRGNSPTWGCQQCGQYGIFGYTIYPPPPDHPVYNKPLPGVGWSNTSVFSFWASPFSRPAGAVIDTGCSENGQHWAETNYSNPTGAVVHMFHSGLWGGWSFAVDNVTRSLNAAVDRSLPVIAAVAAAVAAPPAQGLALWLDALAITGVADGAPLQAWQDNSGHGGQAAQSSAQKQPTFVAKGWLGGTMPVVRFSGAQALVGGLNLPATTTMLAVVKDAGTRTTYCSGVFTSGGDSLNSLCTRAASAQSPQPNDDDPPAPGSAIVATALDWGGSPADPGHRDLMNRPIVLSATYSPDASIAFVDGCVELEQLGQGNGAAGSGFFVGTRNDEDDRYLVGDVAEVLVYSRVLNATDHAAAVAYLAAKWNIASTLPKKCASPPAPAQNLMINFGYGGYQEARGSGINRGQHAYIENVFEELDADGEWFYAAAAQQLFMLPNITQAALEAATLAMPVIDSVLVVNGSQTGVGNYVTGVSFAGFTITQTRVTYLEIYEVPSGGDWSVHRGASFFVQDAENVTVAGCRFDQVGGNGIILSNHVHRSTVADTEFVYPGDSAIVTLGATNGIDAGAPTDPNFNSVLRNLMHENGVYGKQTSCFAQHTTANTTLKDNVCFNGPRAGLNLNDGMGGGHQFRNNVVYNAVRETGDHGPLK